MTFFSGWCRRCLCDSEDPSREAAVALFQELGYAVQAADFIPFMGTGEANFLGGVANLYKVPNFNPAEAKKRFFEIYIETVSPVSGTSIAPRVWR